MNKKVIWDYVQPYFNRKEKWGDPDKVKWYHLHLLRAVREVVGYPFIIHCSYETSGHAPNSFHYSGEATDFHILMPGDILSQLDALRQALWQINMAQFTGLGVYPHWNSPGFHIDSRGYRVRWVRDAKGQYIYSINNAYQYIENL